MTYDEAIGLAIYVNRRILGISQPDLAASLGISASGLSRVENGITKPTVSQLRQAADRLSVTSATLIEDAERYLARAEAVVTRKKRR